MKSFRSIRRYFRDAIHGVFRNFSLSLASISCITITLIVVAVSLILSYNVEHFSDSIRKDVTVVMFLKKETTKEDLTKIKKELYHNKIVKHIWRVPWPTDCGWKFFLEKLNTDQAEYIGENLFELYHDCFQGKYKDLQ